MLAVATSTGFFDVARCAPGGTKYQPIAKRAALGAVNEIV